MAKLLGTLRVKLSAEAQDFARGLNRAKGNVNSLSRSLNKLKSSAIVQVASFAALGLAIRKSLEAANTFDAAQRQLASSAKLTGVSLAALQSISRDVQTRFHLSASSANELTVTMSKLAGQAGQLAKTGDALNAVLDLGAARGMSASQTLESLKMVLVGTDNGFDRLIGKNMSQVWKEWAKAEKVNVGTMSDMQKQLAVFDEILHDGETVRGSYRDFLGSAAGQQELLSQGITQTEVALGKVLQPALIALIPVLIKSTDLLQMSIRGWRELAASMVLVAPALKVVKAALFTGHLDEAMTQMDAAVAKWRAAIAEITNPKPITANVHITPKPTATNTTDQARENILLTDAIERSKILASVAETRLGSQAKISDKLRIELALEDQLFTLRKNALNADATLSGQKRKDAMLSLNLGHQRHLMELRLNAAAEQQVAILNRQLQKRQQLTQTVEQQVAGLAGAALSGGVSGSQIGASIGTVAEVALPHIPIVSELLPGIGGFIGGLFDKDKAKPQPIVKGLDAIERAQRDTISTIKASTDKLLSPQDRFLNLPSSFNVPSFRPSVGNSVSLGDTHVTVNVTNTNASATDISREVERVMGEVLFEQRRTMAWS